MLTMTSRNMLDPFSLLKELDSMLKDPVIYRRSFDDNIQSDESSLTLSIDVPGVKKDDLKVSVVGQLVKISGVRNGKERTQEYRVDKMYDPSTIDAKHEDGVLTLKFRCSEKVKLKQIDVKIS